MVRRLTAVTAALSLGAGLLAAGAATAQVWQSERLPPDGARAIVAGAGGDAWFAIECAPGAAGPTVRAAYRPSDMTAIRLRPLAFTGEGETGDGATTGYLFLNFDSSSVQQFVRRDPARDAFVADAVEEVLLHLLRSDNRLSVTPGFLRDPAYDRFVLRGSSRAIAAALAICAQPPLPPPSLAAPPPQEPPAAAEWAAPPPAPADRRRLGESDDFLAMAEGEDCSRSPRILVLTTQADGFASRRAQLEALVAEVRPLVTAGCPEAEQLRIAGLVGDIQVYDGVAAAAAGWTLIDLMQPAEYPGALPELPAAPASAPLPEEAAPVVADLVCPGAERSGFAGPTGTDDPLSAETLVYSDGDDVILLTPDFVASRFDAAAGDDVIYVYDLRGGAEVTGGEGADTVVICSMSALSLVVTVGEPDAVADTVIIEPAVLLGVPPGLTRVIRVVGFSQPSDRLILKVPPGLGDVAVTSDGIVTVGNVLIQIAASAASPQRFDPSGVVVQEVAAPTDAPSEAPTDAPIGAALSSADGAPGLPGAGIGCPRSTDPADYVAPTSISHDTYTYGGGNDVVLATEVAGIRSHVLGAGDDLVYVVGAGAQTHLSLGAGADTVVFCALAELAYTVAAGDELSSTDADADVIIFEAAAFRTVPAGSTRHFFIYSISPANDRIVVRVPPELDATLHGFADGFPEVRVGATVIRIDPTGLEPLAPVDEAMVVIEHVPG